MESDVWKLRLGAGILIFWCANHRRCLGWVVLPSSESLELVYNAIATRFSKIPEVYFLIFFLVYSQIICYDNACNLAEYCYNRAPEFFSDSIFVVDGFHYKGHINCSHSYNSSKLMVMKEVCSVVHEQKNALLAKIKIPAYYMRYDSFVYLVYALTSLLNCKQKSKSS